MVSLTLLAVIGGVLFLTTASLSSAFRTGTVVAEVDSLAARTLDRVCEPLKGSSADMIDPQSAAPFPGDSLDYQQGAGVKNGALAWGPEEHIELEYDEADDGQDNDGDGLVDECRIVWTQNPGVAGERTIVLCRSVREYLEGETEDGNDENGNGLIDERGLAFEFVDGRLVVRLSIEMRDKEGFPIVSTVQRTIAFRNQGN